MPKVVISFQFSTFVIASTTQPLKDERLHKL